MPYGVSSTCSSCTDRPSVTSCEGCGQKFCSTCQSNHRNELSLQLDELFNRRNELVVTMNTQIPATDDTDPPCLVDINRWQDDMIANINRIASRARQSARQMLRAASQDFRSKLDNISHDLSKRQKTSGYVEGDLERIRQQLSQLEDDLKRVCQPIRIETSNTINWDSLLVVVPNRASQIDARTITHQASSTYQVSNRPTNRPGRTILVKRQAAHCSFPLPSAVNNSKPINTPPPYTFATPANPFYTPPSTRRATLSSRTYQCICCKTTNYRNDSGASICSVCRSPAQL